VTTYVVCRADYDGKFVDCCGWDCPFHTFSLAEALGESSSLLLSKCVDSHFVPGSFQTQSTSTHASVVAHRPLLCAVWTFLPKRAAGRLPATPILLGKSQLCYYTRMEIWEEKKPAKNGRKQRRNLIIALVLVFLITFPVVPFLIYRYGIESPAQTNKEIAIEIRSGSSVYEIAESLKDAGLINSPALFKVYLKLNNLETNIQAGVYSIPPMTSMQELVDILQFGRNDISIRYVEGWRVEQLGDLLAKKLKNIDYTEFVTEARKYEGYLFPDTYYINVESTQTEVLELLRGTFEEKTSGLLSEQDLSRIGLTGNEAVIMASIVEREAANPEDRKIIAGILLTRLRDGMRLEADATTQYAVALPKHCVPEECREPEVVCDLDPSVAVCETGLQSEYLDDMVWWPHKLTQYDLDFLSPYNTRSTEGLPPGPISSFSLSALEAVINSTPTDYYFYLTDADGVTHYAKDLDGHIQNINTYLR